MPLKALALTQIVHDARRARAPSPESLVDSLTWSLADVAFWTAVPGGTATATEHRQALAPALMVGFRAAAADPLLGIALPAVQAATVLAVRRLSGQPLRLGQLPWLWMLAVPGVALHVARSARVPAALEQDEKATVADRAEAAAQARHDVIEADAGLVHTLRDVGVRLSGSAGRPIHLSAAVAWKDALRRLEPYAADQGARYVGTVCREWLEEQAATRPGLNGRLVLEPDREAMRLLLTSEQTATLRAWLRTTDSYGTVQVQPACAATRPGLVLSVGGVPVVLGGVTLEPWSWDPGPLAMLTAALLQLPGITTASRPRDQLRGAFAAVALVAASLVLERSQSGQIPRGQSVQIGMAAAAALLTASSHRPERLRRRHRETAAIMPWPVLALANVASVWGPRASPLDVLLVAAGVGGGLWLTWRNAKHSVRDRVAALAGLWPAVAFTWDVAHHAQDASVQHVAHRERRLQRLTAETVGQIRHDLAEPGLLVVAELREEMRVALRSGALAQGHAEGLTSALDGAEVLCRAMLRSPRLSSS